jgi:hypothetical protein
MSSYRESLVAAGAQVIEFANFGDWQGSWLALVEYQGQRGWVQGYFGSCNYCDAFEAAFDWDSDFVCEDVQQRLAQFGRNYLNDLQTTEEVLREYDRDSVWDSDSEQAASWVRHTVQKNGVE